MTDAETSSKNKSPRLITRIAGFIMLISFFTNIYLTYLSIHLYRETLTHWSYLLIVLVLWVFIFFFLSSRLFIRYLNVKSSIGRFFYILYASGAYPIYLLLALNLYYPSVHQETYQVKILKTGHFYKPKIGCAETYAKVFVKDQYKYVEFPCDYDFKGKNLVNLSIQQGYFGLDIITAKAAH